MKRASWESSRPHRTRLLRMREADSLLRRWLSVWLCAILSFALQVMANAADLALHLDSAAVVVSDATEPPPDLAAWQPQKLPDAWGVSRPDLRQGYVWYRFRFELPRQPEQPYAVHLPAVRTVAEVFVNHMLIGRTAATEHPEVARRPKFFLVPPSALRSGSNDLYVRVFGAKGFSKGLAPITVGADELVRAEYERRYYWQVTGVQFNVLLATIFGTFTLLLWLRRRQDTLYAYFGLSSFCWAIYASSSIVLHPPMPLQWWYVVVMTAAYGKLVFMSLFAVRYGGWHWPKVERLLWIWFGISVGVFYAANVGGSSNWFIEAWGDAWLVGAVFYAAVLAAVAWLKPTPQNLLVAITGAIHPIVTAYDDYANLTFGTLSLVCYDYLPMQFAILWILVDRFLQSLKKSEKLNAELEQRVAQKHAELEQNYVELRQMERQQVVADERQRIMSDMHDGIGGQLISALSLIEHGQLSSKEVAAALRECIEDLRLTIDSLEPTDNDLLTVLGNLRYRIDGRLKVAGINLDWQVKEVPKLACLTPQNVLHILRILQEAFTNVLKHANADAVSVETGVDASGANAFIRVHDNGKGFRGDRVGHGLANMRQRARTIGGKLDIEPSATGTTLELLLPVG